MIRRCLSCYRPFEPNHTLEYLPDGRRVAYDPARGRLWVICPGCARWTLAPLETRWETLEQLERLSTGGARLLKQGENVALLESGPLEIVRVGAANAREEAWWRYGREFAVRRRHARALATGGKVIDALVMLAVVGIPFWGHSDAEHWIDRGRNRSFGKHAWRGSSTCPGCGGAIDTIRFDQRAHLYLDAHQGSRALWFACQACGSGDPGTGHQLVGVTAEHVLRRVLAYHNFAGAAETAVGAALSLVQSYAAPELLIGEAAGKRAPVTGLSGLESLAREIALNSSLEAQLLADEVASLELRWREEEELAAIIDGELTPLRRGEG